MQVRWKRPKLCAALILMVACWIGSTTLNAQTQPSDSPIELDPSGMSRLFLFRSDHFELYTDLEPRDTIEVLDRIELVVSNLGVYWGQPLKGKIKCFVVSDLSVWPAELLSDANGRAKIAERSGMIVAERMVKEGGAESFNPVVYTFADTEMPQRQVVRAFCWQTFGRCGPDWFAEGLAEVGAHWRKEGGIHCPPWMVEYLRNNASVSPRAIIDSRHKANQAWETAAQRWGSCYMLANDPRYSQRFRQFGRDQLQGQPVDFAQRFPELGAQLDTDYQKFLSRLPVEHRSTASTAD